jgi:uncharacterized protein YjiS (DUF1127 family)
MSALTAHAAIRAEKERVMRWAMPKFEFVPAGDGRRSARAAPRLRALLRRWRQRERSRRELASMDERMLRDIGLSAGEARFEAGKPFWRA